MTRSVLQQRQVRKATTKDAPRIAIIHIVAWQVAYRGLMPDAVLARLSLQKRVAFWLQNVRQTDRQTWVLEEQGRVTGWAGFGASRDSDAQKRPVGEIYGIYLAPSVWGRGGGGELLDSACTELKRQGFPEATLWVLENNHNARGFYEKMGFALDRGVKKAVPRHTSSLPEVRYRKVL